VFKSYPHLRRKHPIHPNSDGSSGPSSENALALELILTRLKSLKTTIEVNQFFPRLYFASRLSLDMAFDPENTETYGELRAFTKKYSFGGDDPSWAQHTGFEVDTFQSYDAPDFKEYLGLKFGHLAHVAEESCASSTEIEAGSSGRKSSSETAPTSTGTSTLDCPKVKDKGGVVGCSGVNGNGKVSPNVDHGSVRSYKSGTVKGKLKGVFGFGSKRKRNRGGLCTAPERTKALLEKHNSVLSGGKR